MYDQSRNVPDMIMTGPIASPSSPSVRLTAFDQHTTTKMAKGT